MAPYKKAIVETGLPKNLWQDGQIDRSAEMPKRLGEADACWQRFVACARSVTCERRGDCWTISLLAILKAHEHPGRQ